MVQPKSWSGTPESRATIRLASHEGTLRVRKASKGTPSEWFTYNVKGYYTHMDDYIFQRWALFGIASGLESWVTNQVVGTDAHVNIYPFAGAKLLVGGEDKNLGWEYEGFTLDAGG